MEYLGTDMMKGQAENWNKHHLIHSKSNKKFEKMLFIVNAVRRTIMMLNIICSIASNTIQYIVIQYIVQ